MNRIEQLNVDEQGTAIYGITHLADLTEGEFTQVYLNPRLADATKKESPAVNPMDVSPPAFDWRNLSAVTDVKNQVEKLRVELRVDDLFSGSMWIVLGLQCHGKYRRSLESEERSTRLLIRTR